MWRFTNMQEDTLEEKADMLKIAKKLPDDVDWSQLVADKHESLFIQPALPDKAVIIRPVKNISVLPSMKIDIVVKIPLWIQFYTGAIKPDNMIHEFPGVNLSPTWFGEPDNGELAYRLPQRIFFNLEGKIAPYEAICQRIACNSDFPATFNTSRSTQFVYKQFRDILQRGKGELYGR